MDYALIDLNQIIQMQYPPGCYNVFHLPGTCNAVNCRSQSLNAGQQILCLTLKLLKAVYCSTQQNPDYSSPDAMNDRRLVTILVLFLLAPLNVWAQASMPAAAGAETLDAGAAASTGHGNHDHAGHGAGHDEVHEQVHGHEQSHGEMHDEMHNEMHNEMHQELHKQMHEEPEELQSSAHMHEHDADDCDEYCMNCSNHCSSTAIVTTSAHPFALDRKFSRAASADLSTRATLLFRPPIHS